MRNRLCQGAGQVLNAQRVRVTGRFKGRSLMGSIGGTGGHLALSHVVCQAVEDLRKVGVDPRDRRTSKGACQVAVLAVSRATLRKVHAPVRTGWDRLQAALAGRRDHNSKGCLGVGHRPSGHSHRKDRSGDRPSAPQCRVQERRPAPEWLAHVPTPAQPE